MVKRNCAKKCKSLQILSPRLKTQLAFEVKNPIKQPTFSFSFIFTPCKAEQPATVRQRATRKKEEKD